MKFSAKKMGVIFIGMIVAVGGTAWGSANVNESQQQSESYSEAENQEALFLMEVLIELANINFLTSIDDEYLSNLKKSSVKISSLSGHLREIERRRGGYIDDLLFYSELLESIYQDSIKMYFDKETGSPNSLKDPRYKKYMAYIYDLEIYSGMIIHHCLFSLSEDDKKDFLSRIYKNSKNSIDSFYEQFNIFGDWYINFPAYEIPCEDRVNVLIHFYLSEVIPC